MGKIEVIQHKLKGCINLCVWYRGKPQNKFIYTVYPSHYHLLDYYRGELVRDFKLTLI